MRLSLTLLEDAFSWHTLTASSLGQPRGMQNNIYRVAGNADLQPQSWSCWLKRLTVAGGQEWGRCGASRRGEGRIPQAESKGWRMLERWIGTQNITPRPPAPLFYPSRLPAEGLFIAGDLSFQLLQVT